MVQLDAISPLAVLARGYALAWKLPGREVVRDAGQLSPADKLLLKFGKGSAQAAVETVEEEPDG
jgi:exodeoxyribonuclease VII large subunit